MLPTDSDIVLVVTNDPIADNVSGIDDTLYLGPDFNVEPLQHSHRASTDGNSMCLP